ncbi:TauD/TfdA family dioxygenase [Azospirillum sp. TSA6c]|uniref:TauD/TfdA family dioxygenase n=1 Tax=unclassified Azospirillum TaxID=2630922 RepID=UPI000D652619|nr:TauD/TfdA family dioxygenase [Azospirillum sp. TSA6c]
MSIDPDSVTVSISPDAAERIAAHAAAMDAEAMEAAAAGGRPLPADADRVWGEVAPAVRAAFAAADFAILRGLPALEGGRMLMAAAALLGRRFHTYGGGKVVKIFAMSPWRNDLAHTAADGFFHTDLNASPQPPALTGIQCIVPDPGAPQYGVNRVVRTADLLAALEESGRTNALHFLCEETVGLANDRSTKVWHGRIVSDGITRYHPETVRAACRRDGVDAPEEILETIQAEALRVSRPFQLGTGDMLLLSNHRTLHYRGECSIAFQRFPMDFVARRIYVLHVSDEHQTH